MATHIPLKEATQDHLFPMLREPQRIRRPEHTYRYTITILHPAYEPPGNVLFVFNATDHPSGAIHYETARIACGILAGNRWDGYFTAELNGPKLKLGQNELLSKGEYYFHVPGLSRGAVIPNVASNRRAGPSSPYKYPVIPTFEEWPFPHNNLPSFWTSGNPSWPTLSPAASISSKVTARDQTCRVTDAEEACEMAHIIPSQEQEWYDKNSMRKYSGFSHRSLKDASNIMRLRRDLHFLYDNRKFVFVPKASSSSDTTCWVLHTMDYSKDLLALYHNLQLHDVSGIPQEYLFARFAWTLFPDIEGFLVAGVERLLIVASSSHEAFVASSEQCKTFLPQSNKAKSRSQSPTKRPRSLEEHDSCSNVKCPRLDSSVRRSGSSLSDSSPRTIVNTFEDASFNKIVKDFLQTERDRSDPGGTWLAEQIWMDEQDESKPMTPASYKRWCRAKGMEMDDDDER